jgi:hypothetical protein
VTSWKVLPSARTWVRCVVSAWVTAMFVHAAFPPFCAPQNSRSRFIMLSMITLKYDDGLPGSLFHERVAPTVAL